MILKATNISFNAPTIDRVILQNTDLTINKGDFVILLGANGSGKSTLLKLLSGQITPSSGNISINDISINKLSSHQKSCDIVTLSQNAEDRLFLDMTISENIALWESRFLKNSQKIDERIHARFQNSMNNKVRHLSGGERQALLLYLALTHPPQILFLDEHTSALDYKASSEIMTLTASEITNNHTTTIMVTHNIQDAISYGNRIIIMNKGLIIYDHYKSEDLSIDTLTIETMIHSV